MDYFFGVTLDHFQSVANTRFRTARSPAARPHRPGSNGFLTAINPWTSFAGPAGTFRAPPDESEFPAAPCVTGLPAIRLKNWSRAIEHYPGSIASMIDEGSVEFCRALADVFQAVVRTIFPIIWELPSRRWLPAASSSGRHRSTRGRKIPSEHSPSSFLKSSWYQSVRTLHRFCAL